MKVVGRIVVVNFTSLDGVVQAPLEPDEDTDGAFDRGGWVPPYGDDTVNTFMQRSTVGAAALLLGRRTYENFRRSWEQPDPTEDAVVAMNRMPKLVVTRFAEGLDWSGSRQLDVHDDPTLSAVRAARDEIDGDLVVFGSAHLVGALTEADLVDEYRLLLFPLLLGAGKRMFRVNGPAARLRLTDHAVSSTGVAILTYSRADPT